MRREDEDDKSEEMAPRHSTRPANNSHSPLKQRLRYGPGAFPTTSSAQFARGQTQGMPSEFQKIFDTLMRQVQGPTDLELAEEGDSEEDTSEDDRQDPRMTHSVDMEMSNLSLDESRPAYSYVKSEAQNPYHPFPAPGDAASPLNPDRFRPESVPALPEHMQRPFIMPPNPAAPTPGPYAAYAPASIPPWHSDGQQTSAASPASASSKLQFSIAPVALPPPPLSPPIYNAIHGDYIKVDQSAHATNIGPGNAHSMTNQDSYDDNSVKKHEQPGKLDGYR